MKALTTLLSVALLATGILAAPSELNARQQEFVLLGRNVNFTGPGSDQLNLPVTPGQCASVPPSFANDVSAISPNSGLSCVLYNAPGCVGATPPGPNGLPVTDRVNDLGAPPYFWDDQTESLLCERV